MQLYVHVYFMVPIDHKGRSKREREQAEWVARMVRDVLLWYRLRRLGSSPSSGRKKTILIGQCHACFSFCYTITLVKNNFQHLQCNFTITYQYLQYNIRNRFYSVNFTILFLLDLHVQSVIQSNTFLFIWLIF